MAVYVFEEYNRFAQYAEGMASEAGRIVLATIRRIEARTKASLSGPRSGRLYQRGAKGTIVHQASAPGEAPATDTGNLANSIGAQMIGRSEGEVTVGAEYAVTLELGGGKIAPRPFLQPAVTAEWPEFLNAMKVLGE